jgi:hypothetical protein
LFEILHFTIGIRGYNPSITILENKLHHVSIAQEFYSEGNVLRVREFGNGNINDTYLVHTDSAEEKHFVLQRINTHVFKQPKLIMQNLRIFTEHMRKRAGSEEFRWEMPRVLRTRDKQDYHIDSNGDFWRAISYVDGAKSYDTIRSVEHAREVGYALGTFQNLISDLPVEDLSDTLEGYHITPRYLQQFDHAFSQNGFASSAEVKYCIGFVEQRRAFAHTLEDARERGKLQLRIMHGDPKVNNLGRRPRTGRRFTSTRKLVQRYWKGTSPRRAPSLHQPITNIFSIRSAC